MFLLQLVQRPSAPFVAFLAISKSDIQNTCTMIPHVLGIYLSITHKCALQVCRDNNGNMPFGQQAFVKTYKVATHSIHQYMQRTVHLYPFEKSVLWEVMALTSEAVFTFDVQEVQAIEWNSWDATPSFHC